MKTFTTYQSSDSGCWLVCANGKPKLLVFRARARRGCALARRTRSPGRNPVCYKPRGARVSLQAPLLRSILPLFLHDGELIRRFGKRAAPLHTRAGPRGGVKRERSVGAAQRATCSQEGRVVPTRRGGIEHRPHERCSRPRGGTRRPSPSQAAWGPRGHGLGEAGGEETGV